MPSQTLTPRAASLTERLLWSVFLLCGLYTCFWGFQVHAARRQSRQIAVSAAAAAPDTAAGSTSSDGHVIGRLDIPALKLDVPVLSNYDPDSLKRGVGHIQGTAMPGGLGTLGLAGHRDTFFRPLRNISKNMDIRVTDATGTFHYLVDSTEIVTPDQVRVLDILNEPKLTLVTCYPFDFIGQAPKRFIVHAHLLSLEPDPPASQSTRTAQ